MGLLESAPLLVAHARGFFSTEGVEVELFCDLGVAAISGKLTDRRIEGACLPAQMPVLLSLGAGTTKVPMDPVLVTCSQDMAIVLSKKAVNAGAARSDARALKIGVLGHSSPACHLVKRWLQLQSNDPRTDAVFVSLAVSQLTHFFEEGLIDGFCGLDPLPGLATLHTEGVIVATSATLSPLHPGSVVALRADFSQEHPGVVKALARALRRAQAFCADPANREEFWSLVLAQNPFGSLNDETREALFGLHENEVLNALSIRFESAGNSRGLDARGASFLEFACRAALGSSERSLNLGSEIERLYLSEI